MHQNNPHLPVDPTGVQQLQETLQTQGQQYGHLLSLLETLNESASVQDTHSQAVLNSVQHQLRNLAGTSDRLQALQKRLGPDVTRSSPELREEIVRQEQLLKNCLQRIAQLETHFTERRRRLKPELDESARRRSMHSAYQQSLKTG